MPSTGTLTCVTPWNADDTTYHTFIYNSTDDRQGYAIADMPSDFGTMDSQTVIPTVTYLLSEALANDTISLDCRVVNAGQTVLLAGATNTYDDTSWRVIANNITNTTDVTWAPGTAFTWNDTTSGKAVWDTAILEIRMRKTKSGGWDAATLLVDYGAIVGTYTAQVTTVYGTGSVTGTATLAGSGDVTVYGTGAVTGTATPTATGLTTVYGTASVTGTATLAATGGTVIAGTGALTGAATLSCTGTVLRADTFRPNGDGTIGGNVESGGWADIDDDPDTPTDSDYVLNVAGSAATAFFDLTPAPVDYSTGDSITLTMRASSRGTTGSQALHFQLYESDETTPITVEVTRTFSTDEVRTDSDVAMAWSAGAPTKAQLDGARLRVRWTV